MSEVCECTHNKEAHKVRIEKGVKHGCVVEDCKCCRVKDCPCLDYVPYVEKVKEIEKVEQVKRYKIGPAGNAYVVIDTAIDSVICYCNRREYADSIITAMNYLALCDIAQKDIAKMDVKGSI
jgi:hypothetical protein